MVSIEDHVKNYYMTFNELRKLATFWKILEFFSVDFKKMNLKKFGWQSKLPAELV